MKKIALVVDEGSDWAAVYEDGLRVAEGHIDRMREEILDRLKIETLYQDYRSFEDTLEATRVR